MTGTRRAGPGEQPGFVAAGSEVQTKGAEQRRPEADVPLDLEPALPAFSITERRPETAIQNALLARMLFPCPVDAVVPTRSGRRVIA